MGKKLLCIIFGNGGTAPNLVYDGLSKLKSDFVVFYTKPGSESLKRIYDEWIPKFGENYAIENDNSIEEMVVEYSKKNRNIDGIITFTEKLLILAAKISEQLNLPFNTVNSIENSQNKFKQREQLNKNNVPIPKYYLIKNTEDLVKASNHTKFPAVLKPAYGSGSYFVQSIKDFDELYSVYTQVIKDYSNLMNYESESKLFLLEEEMQGENYHKDSRYGDYASVESIIFKGEIKHLCITDRMPLAKPFRETGFILPSNLPNDVQQELFEIAENSIKSLGLNHGFTHIEIKFTPEGPKVIEVNARAGGGFPYRLGLADPEYDLFYEYGKLSLNIPPNMQPNFTKVSGSIIYQSPNELLKIKKINGKDKLKSIPGIDLCISVAKENDVIDPRKGLQNIIAFFYLKGNSHDEIFSAAKKVKSIFTIDYD